MFLPLICPTEDGILECVALALTRYHVIDFFRRCVPSDSVPYIVRPMDYAYIQWSMFQRQLSYSHNNPHRSRMVHENPEKLGSICSLNFPKLHPSNAPETCREYQPIPNVCQKSKIQMFRIGRRSYVGNSFLV